MIRQFQQIWKRITRYGIYPGQIKGVKRQILLNTIWFMGLAGYLIFFGVMLYVSKGSLQMLVISNFVMLTGFAVTRVLVGQRKILAAKCMLMSVIYCGIFFYDHSLGNNTSVDLYYISFLFATINLFSFRYERVFLLLFTLLPVALHFLSGLSHFAIFVSPVISPAQAENFSVFNFILAYLLIALYAIFIINYNARNEESLAQARINLQTLVDNSNTSIWSISSDFKIIVTNRTFNEDMLKYFGYEIEQGFDVRQVFSHPDCPEFFNVQNMRALSGEVFFEEYEFRGRYFEIHATPIYDIRGEVTGAAFNVRNISSFKRGEMALVEALDHAEQASLAKAQFLSNMSHELRTPLNGIIGISNLLLSEPFLPEQKEHLEILKYSSGHMLALVNNVLDFSRIDAGKAELENSPFLLREMIDKVSNAFFAEATQKQLFFELHSDKALDIVVLGDIVRLRQVLNNLLSNAIKFTETGYVRFGAELLEKKPESIRVRFSVTDSGIGIAKENQEKIFDSFTQADTRTTRRYGGTGLGLTISKKLLKMMDSELQLESSPDRGSRFSFDIELATTTRQEQHETNITLEQMDILANLEVLVAEDNPVNQLVVKKILAKWNIVVTCVDNGLEAVNLLSGRPFDLVLMDLEMPVMDGLTAVSKIREFNSRIPIIALTAANYENLSATLAEKGLNDFVQKPFHPQELNEKISRLANKNPVMTK